ncbi:LOW QUALITY PROTEIN: molybdenum cofactor synthesis 1 [Aphomia sociella]
MKKSFINIKWLSRVAKVESDATKYCLTASTRLYSNVTTDAAPAAETAAENTVLRSKPLVDLMGRRHNYLRISLTERCNLRCQYCMPAEGVPLSARAALLSTAELLRLARVFAALGVDKVRLTGGEPTLRADLDDVIRGLNSIPGIRSVSMTTNGLVLVRRLPALQRAGLAAINVSLDSLRATRYEQMARRPGLSRVLAGVDLALQLGYRPVKINTVLMKGFNDDEILDFVEYTREREVEVRFIEFMPFSGNRWDASRLVPQRAALRALLERHPATAPLPARPHHTARVWQVPGYAGSVGFISSMTENFCSGCNRLRITADGNLKVCLFGAAEVSLRDALRAQPPPDDAALERLVRDALRRKRAKHAGERAHAHAHAPGPVAREDRAQASRTPGESRRAERYRSDYSFRYGEPRAHGEPSDDSDRRLAGARRACAAARRRPRVQLARRRRADAPGRAGPARMVDVGHKPVTARVAEAECALVVGGRLLRLLRDARLPKGDALTVAELAGVLAAKRTAELIPLCHPLPLDSVRVRVSLPPGDAADAAGGALRVRCEARATARTGAEMEALVGCALAALALYDMCKAVDRGMRVTELRVVRKAGGDGDAQWPDAAADDAPSGETYAPTNMTHF